MPPLATFDNARRPPGPAALPRVGDRLGRFKLRRLIGQIGRAHV